MFAMVDYKGSESWTVWIKHKRAGKGFNRQIKKIKNLKLPENNWRQLTGVILGSEENKQAHE